jgi:translocator protein
MKLSKKIATLIVCLIACYSASFIGAIASFDAPEFYISLNKPSWSPPASIFGPVWTALYTMIGISLWLIYTKNSFSQNKPLFIVFFFQLFLNALWSWIFFSWKMGFASLVEIFILLIFIAINTLLFYNKNKIAGILLIPYFLWVTFATFLTYTLWQLNPTLL